MFGEVRVRTKLMALIAGVCLMALAGACAAFVWYDRKSYSEAKQATLSVLVDAVAKSATGPVAFADGESAQYVLKTIEPEATALSAAIYLPDGSRLTSWHREGTELDLPETAKDLPKAYGIVGSELRVGRPIEQNGQDLGQLYAVFSTQDIEARTQQFLSIAALVLLLSLLGAWIVASLAHGVLTKPVSNLVEAVTRVEREQDFTVRAEKVSQDELGLLTDSFNAMLAAVELRDAELAEYRSDLERRVEARTKDLDARNAAMRLVLDNVDQGFVTIDRDGVLLSERSEAFDAFFSAPEPGARLWDHLDQWSEDIGLALEMGWESVTDGLLPIELSLEQLPCRLHTHTDRYFDIAYRPIMDGEEIDKTLIIFTDVTASIAREREQAQQSETIAIFEGIAHNSAAFIDFFNEARRLMLRVLEGNKIPLPETLRDLHTLKGNFGVSRMHMMAAHIHSVEDHCMQSGEHPSAEVVAELKKHWDDFAGRVRTFVSGAGTDVHISRDEYDQLAAALHAEGASEEVQGLVANFIKEPASARLQRLAAEVERVAKRLQLGEVQVAVEDGGVRLMEGSGWLWGVLPHLVRNGVDHGLRGAKDAGRDPRMRLAARIDGHDLVVDIADNGRGIDWEALREKAQSHDLAHKTQEDLVSALFADNISTRSDVTQLSGRGVGLAAVRSAVQDHGGHIDVASDAQGTCFSVTVPLASLTENSPTREAVSA